MKTLEAQRPRHARRLQGFHDLVRYRVMEILLVCSPYDNFILEQAGQISERVYGELRSLDLHSSLGLTRVSSGREALSRLAERRFDFVVTVPQVADMNASELARSIRDQGLLVPLVLLGYDHRGLEDFAARHDTALFDRAFLWQGDVRILLAIVKYIEDSSTSLTTPLRSASMPRGDEGYLDVLDRAIELSKSATTCNQTAARCSSEDSECPVSALENGADGQTRTDDLLIRIGLPPMS